MNGHLNNLERLNTIVFENNLQADALRRLFILYQPDENLAENLAIRLHLTKKQKSRLINWSKFIFNETKINDEKYLTKVCYLFDKEFCIDNVLFCMAKNPSINYNLSEILSLINNIIVPQFTIKGKDLINLGLTEYDKIGEILEQLEQSWIKHGFEETHEQLLEKSKQYI